MRIVALLILAGTLAGLVACRSEQASPDMTPAKSPVAAPAETDLRPILVCFGDSLTAGYGADPGSSYPDFLQKDLDAQGYSYRVVNAGVSGNTSKDGVERLRSVVALKPAVAVVEFGGNDGLRGVPTQTTHDNLARIVQTLQKSGTKVVLAGITLPPDYGPDYIKRFNSNYTSIAQQFHVPLFPFVLKDVYGVQGMMQADGIHATAQGNQIVARNLLPYLTPILKKS